MNWWQISLVSAGVVAATNVAHAQAIRGIVLDSASRQPVPGVVVSLYDSASTLLGRIVTNQRGQFNVPTAAAVGRIRAQRIGFRPRDLRVQVAPSGFTEVELRIVSLPTMLEPVTSIASSRCPARRDQAATFALLEQARAGLLATVVTRNTDAAAMRMLSFERLMDGNSDRIETQRVRIDSGKTTKSFAASMPARGFVNAGFVREGGPQGTLYFAPDAETLLSDGFTAGYCFKLVEADRARPNQIGLGFDPAGRSRDRVEITGTLWIDTVARALVDLEYRYLDLGRMQEAVRPGGRVSFKEARPGVVLIDRWTMRLPRPMADTSLNQFNNKVVRGWYDAAEVGAELALARWEDTTRWHGHFGALRVIAMHGNSPAAGVTMRLDETDYRGRTDSLGRLSIGELLPGPYVLRAFAPDLEEVGVSLPPSLTFTAARDSMITGTVLVETRAQYAKRRCTTDQNRGTAEEQLFLVAGRVHTRDGNPIAKVEVRAKWFSGPAYFFSWRTGTDGRFDICVTEEFKDKILTVYIEPPGGESRTINIAVREPVTTLPVVIDRPTRFE